MQITTQNRTDEVVGFDSSQRADGINGEVSVSVGKYLIYITKEGDHLEVIVDRGDQEKEEEPVDDNNED